MKNNRNQRPAPVTDAGEIAKFLELQPDESVKFHCQQCNLNTAGVYEGGQQDIRTCPLCHHTLMFCPVCRTCTSATDRYKVLVCDKCQTNYVTETTVRYMQAREHESAEIVLSGIRATGSMHLGNFFGAIDQFVQFQTGPNFCMFFVADLHSLTTFNDPKKIGLNTVAIAADYIAAGLDPERSLIYTQSSVPEITELSLLLSMFQPLGQLERIPTLKEKLKVKPNPGESRRKATERVRRAMNLGLLTYPVLMAADILGPQATLIPVGKDQIPNVELATELARRINNALGHHIFTMPKYSENPIVPGLGGGKMGKSEADSSVLLTDTLEEIRQKYRKFGVTDPKKIKLGSKGRVKRCVSVFPMYKILEGPKKFDLQDEIQRGCESGKLGCADCKDRLAKLLDERIASFRERRKALEPRLDYVADVLHFGGLKAREIIAPTLDEFRARLGLVPA